MGMKVIIAVVMLLSINMNMRALASFDEDLVVSWGNDRLKMEEGGRQWQLTLDKGSGSGFQSKKEYLLADIEMQIKLVSGNSAGTVTAYYLSSQGTNHDEIDFEFLGNVSGQPYIMHTNVFSQGKGGREQQFYLWFDPTADFHKYAASWTSERIVFSVDGVPVRVFRNREKEIGVAYPHTQSMRMFCSLWEADDWATRGGLVKTDWSVAPFVASFKEFKGTAQSNTMATHSDVDKGKLNWVRSNYLVYDYCLDTKRFPQGPPPECRD